MEEFHKKNFLGFHVHGQADKWNFCKILAIKSEHK